MNATALVAVAAVLALGVGFYAGVQVGSRSAPVSTSKTVAVTEAPVTIDTTGLGAEHIQAQPWTLLNQPLLKTQDGRAFRSTDGGRTWVDVEEK